MTSEKVEISFAVGEHLLFRWIVNSNVGLMREGRWLIMSTRSFDWACGRRFSHATINVTLRTDPSLMVKYNANICGGPYKKSQFCRSS